MMCVSIRIWKKNQYRLFKYHTNCVWGTSELTVSETKVASRIVVWKQIVLVSKAFWAPSPRTCRNLITCKLHNLSHLRNANAQGWSYYSAPIAPHNGREDAAQTAQIHISTYYELCEIQSFNELTRHKLRLTRWYVVRHCRKTKELSVCHSSAQYFIEYGS